MNSTSPKASVIIPSRCVSEKLGEAIKSVLNVAGNEQVEIIVVNDGLDTSMPQFASRFKIKVIDGDKRGPASARNIGVQFSNGKILVFLDDDCRVSTKWLQSHLYAHSRYGKLLVVGGSICMEPDASFWARCDHYCSWYNVNSNLPASWVPNHPSANMSVSRYTFERVGPFKEDLPREGVHEEIEWQIRLHKIGGRIRFEPQAKAWHRDRNDFHGYLKHNYVWGYNSIEVKCNTTVSRFPWIYKNPFALVFGFLPFALAHTIYTIVCWVKASKFEPISLFPYLLLGRLAYAIGMAVGGTRSIQKD